MAVADLGGCSLALPSVLQPTLLRAGASSGVVNLFYVGLQGQGRIQAHHRAPLPIVLIPIRQAGLGLPEHPLILLDELFLGISPKTFGLGGRAGFGLRDKSFQSLAQS